MKKEELRKLINLERATADDVNALRTAIRFLDKAYYVDNEHVVSDREYDHLFALLKKLEEEQPQLKTPDSPTQRVAFGLTEDFPTVTHSVPMLSLENTYNEADIDKFHQTVLKLSGEEEVSYTAEPKFDGASIALLYENDVLVRAATRGNGEQGDDITANAKVIRSIPLHAAFSSLGIAKAEVRGEIVIELSAFEALNKAREAREEEPFKNARNTASGGLRMKDSKAVSERRLEAMIYQLAYAVDSEGKDMLPTLTSHFNSLEQLASIGFQTSLRYMEECHSVTAIHDYCTRWEEGRRAFEYEVDGVVVKVNSLANQRDIGATSHHPRWAMAYKFKAQQAQAKLLRVTYQVGRTGAVTPVAKIEPVQLAGVTVSSISLHNEEFITEKDIHLGDTVCVERAGDVIPYVTGVVLPKRPETATPISFPKECPSCSQALDKPQGDAIWRCTNAECPAQAEERLIHFVSKQAMDIDGLGRDIVKRFRSENLLRDIEELYQLNYEAILQLEGWKEKSVSNLRKGIEASKKQPLWRLITGLGIRHVGSQTAKMLARQVEHITAFYTWTPEEFATLEDVGPKVAESLHAFFRNPANQQMLKKLEDLGVNLTAEKQASGAMPLEGKTFVFTGSLQAFTRSEAKEWVEAKGGKALSGVSKKLNYLVAGEKAGSKLSKAKAIPSIEIMDEEAFLAFMEGLEQG